MAESNAILNTDRQIIGIFRHGFAWCKQTGDRLGEYDYGRSGFVYTNDGDAIAHFSQGDVTSQDGRKIGEYRSVPVAPPNGYTGPGLTTTQLLVNGEVVGACIENVGSAAAALTFIFVDHADIRA